MTLSRIRRVVWLVGVSFGMAAAYACVLNPQPLPPGDSADANANSPADGTATLGSGGGDAAPQVNDDSGGGASDAAADAPVGVVPGPDGGTVGSDAGDEDEAGELDGPMDGDAGLAVDAPGDESSDASAGFDGSGG